jgi:manganese transport protein
VAVDETTEVLRGPDTHTLRGLPESAASPQRSWLLLLGPAFVAAVAYIDPGNFATNFAGGGIAGYALVWVVVAANLVAVLVQSLSAKLGLATGRDLAELCRDSYPGGVVRLLWAQAELVAMATDVAEVIGGAIALQILFGMPLLLGGLVTGTVAFALLGLQMAGHRRFELVVAGLLAVVVVGIGYVAVHARIDPAPLVHGFVPQWPHGAVAVVATGILGATVMPHVIYLHSALVAHRPARAAAGSQDGMQRRALRFQRIDIGVALGLAGLVNLAMLVAAAALFGASGMQADLASVAGGLGTVLGGAAATAFAVALLASGFASSGVGTFAGQVVMQGFLRRRVPVWLRRSVTLLPALVVLLLGVDPTRALVVSQVVLSFGIPFALVPLVHLTARRDLMGALVNRRLTTAAASAVGAAIIAVNAGLATATLGPVIPW